MLGISDAAENIGFKTMGVKLDFEKLASDAPLPCIVHWKQNHFVVVYKVSKAPLLWRGGGEVIKGGGEVFVADPAHGLIKYTKEEFLKGWLSPKICIEVNNHNNILH